MELRSSSVRIWTRHRPWGFPCASTRRGSVRLDPGDAVAPKDFPGLARHPEEAIRRSQAEGHSIANGRGLKREAAHRKRRNPHAFSSSANMVTSVPGNAKTFLNVPRLGPLNYRSCAVS